MKVIRLAKSMVERLHYGSFAVKNRSTKDSRDVVSIEERNIREKKYSRPKSPGKNWGVTVLASIMSKVFS